MEGVACWGVGDELAHCSALTHGRCTYFDC